MNIQAQMNVCVECESLCVCLYVCDSVCVCALVCVYVYVYTPAKETQRVFSQASFQSERRDWEIGLFDQSNLN